jgi:subtilisin-like proprotein convertase family protein
VTSSLNCSDTFRITVFQNPYLYAGNDIFVCHGDSVTLNAVSDGSIFWNNNVINGQPFLPATSGYYSASAIIEDVNNCQARDSVFVGIRNFEVNAGDDIQFCGADTVTFEGTSMISESYMDLSLIPDATGLSYQSSINFNSSQPGAVINSISEINKLDLEIEHSYIGDLEIQLTCPNGTSVSILNAYNGFTGAIPGGCGSGISTFFGNDTNIDGDNPGSSFMTYTFSPTNATLGTICAENSAGNTLINAYGFPTMNPNGVYLPDGDFSSFIGCPVNGIWTITIHDNQGIDDGYLASWNIGFSLGNTTTPYLWNNGVIDGTPFLATQTTTYTVTATNELGCVDSDEVSVIVNYPSSSTLNVVAVHSYEFFGEVYYSSGVYQHQLLNSFGCDSTITINLTITPFFNDEQEEDRDDSNSSSTNGVGDLSDAFNLNVYPNPTNDVVTIVSPTVLLGKKYQLLDQSGRELVKGQVTNEIMTLSLKHLTSGIYFLKLNDLNPIRFTKVE